MEILKLNRLETHDRLEHFTKQEFDINECCQDLIKQKPFGEHPFYIFVHARTDDDGVTKRVIWQPRLSRPKSQINSMLFKAYPNTDMIKVIWMIPQKELWNQFRPEKMTYNPTVWESINKFLYNQSMLDRKDPDDLDDKTIDAIYKEISQKAKHDKAKQSSLVVS